MKIAHVSFAVEQSVERKTALMAQAARERGLPIDFYVFTQHAAPYRNENLIVLRLPLTWLGRKLAPKVQWPFRLICAARALKNEEYEAVVLRYPKLPFGWRWFLRCVHVPVMTEHHTNEPAEIRGDGGLLRVAAEKVDRLLRRRFLHRVQGIIAVTGEVLDMVRKDTPENIPGMVITNGVHVASVPLTGHRKFEGSALRMVFVASDFVHWHGLDRLLTGMLQYRGEMSLELRLVGLVPTCYRPLVDRCNALPQLEVIADGCAYGEALHAKLADVHLAVASLGLYRKGMQEACTLKAREYVARGIPFVCGYSDPDIPSECEFVLHVPNDASPVDMEDVIAFAQRVQAEPDYQIKMRRFAEEKLDWRIKIKELYGFVLCHASRKDTSDV